MKEKDRLFVTFEDAIFYVVLLAGSTLYNVFFELQHPTSYLHKLLLISSLVLLHEYYHLFKYTGCLGRRLAFEAYFSTVSLVALLLVSLYCIMNPIDPVMNVNGGYSFNDCWSVLLLVPIVLVTAIEFAISLKESYKAHTTSRNSSNNCSSVKRHRIGFSISNAAKSV